MYESLDTSEPISPSCFTDRDRRWLVHIFAALQQHSRDELKYDSIPFHDLSALVDRDGSGACGRMSMPS